MHGKYWEALLCEERAWYKHQQEKNHYERLVEHPRCIISAMNGHLECFFYRLMVPKLKIRKRKGKNTVGVFYFYKFLGVDDRTWVGNLKCEIGMLGINMTDLTRELLIYHQIIKTKHSMCTIHNF